MPAAACHRPADLVPVFLLFTCLLVSSRRKIPEAVSQLAPEPVPRSRAWPIPGSSWSFTALMKVTCDSCSMASRCCLKRLT